MTDRIVSACKQALNRIVLLVLSCLYYIYNICCIDATVRLECKNETTDEITVTKECLTNSTGQYRIVVDGDHGEELCEVSLVKSSDPNCNELLNGSINSDQVTLTDKDGVIQKDRYANPLGFATKEALSQCTAVLIKMGVLPTLDV